MRHLLCVAAAVRVLVMHLWWCNYLYVTRYYEWRCQPYTTSYERPRISVPFL